ncbi:TnsA-like heteromeric transposase endonuclease subunit [Streptacidiphilus alkalitolerans]|uniref:TnsA-like heteromeric transposase endonuclease subunit n=1 Tax=Streptacidiphilus alkalitolerans TaxID=3342712 RepID=UPI0036D348D0
MVIDVRADERIEPKDMEAFEATRMACAQAEWGLERAGTPKAALMASARWLSRYRHPRCLDRTAANRLREVFANPGPLLSGADAAGDRLATLPALFHLLWRQELVAEDLSIHLTGPRTIVGVVGRDAR